MPPSTTPPSDQRTTAKMGSGKKEAARKERQGKTNNGMGNVKVKGENFYRDAKKVKTLNMFKDGKAQRNAAGKITKAASYQSRDKPNARIEPHRKWFTDTRVIAQDSLAQFRDAVAKNQNDPYSYLLKQNKLPMSLIRDDKSTKNGIKQHEAKMKIETQPFGETFGPKAKKRKMVHEAGSLEDMAARSEKMHDDYLERKEQADLLSGKTGEEEQREADDTTGPSGEIATAIEPIFSKGQSKRIWNELYKVIDSSDVVIHVLDARDPEGTRCRSVEKYIREEAPHKHLLFVLNKCDLVPTAITVSYLQLFYPQMPALSSQDVIQPSALPNE